MNISWTLGAYEIGLVFATVLYGIVVAQTFTYTQEKFMDPIWLRFLVGIVCLFDTVHTFSIWSLLYYWSVNNFGNEAGLLKIHWMFITAFAFSPTTGAIVQSFFAYRMFLLLSKPYLPIIIWMGAVTRIGFAIVRVVALDRSGTIPQAIARYSWILTTTLSINVVLDTLNTAGLLYCLTKNRSSLRSRKTVDKLLRYTVEIGLTTTICAVVTLGLVQYKAHQNFIFIGFFAIYPKLFANSFLASLNARAEFRRNSETTVMSDICVVQDSQPEEHLLERMQCAKGTSTASSSTHPPASPASSLRAPPQSQLSSEHG